MRVPSYREYSDIRENTSMTSMIDVVFLLLIFFVCGAIGQVQELMLPSNLSAGSVESQELPTFDEESLPPVWLFLRWDEQQQTTVVQLNRGGVRYTDLNVLRENLIALAEVGREEMPVILDVGDKVPFGDWVAVDDICKQADFHKINLATELPAK